MSRRRVCVGEPGMTEQLWRSVHHRRRIERKLRQVRAEAIRRGWRTRFVP